MKYRKRIDLGNMREKTQKRKKKIKNFKESFRKNSKMIRSYSEWVWVGGEEGGTS